MSYPQDQKAAELSTGFSWPHIRQLGNWDSLSAMKLTLIDSRTISASDTSFWTNVRRGELLKVHGTFYVDSYRWKRLKPWERERVHAVAVGRASRSAALVGRSAATLWGLPVMHQREPFVAELMYPEHRRPGGKQKQQRDVRFRVGYLREEDVVVKNGARVTSLSRTAIDAARFEDFPHALMIIEGLLRAHPRLFSEVKREIDSAPRAKGMPQARRIFAIASTRSESPGESLALGHFCTSGLHSLHDVIQNPTLTVNGRTYRPDFLIDGWLIVEVDGEIKYNGELQQLDEALNAERLRETQLQNAGFRVLRFRWPALVTGEFIADIERALQAGHHGIAEAG